MRMVTGAGTTPAPDHSPAVFGVRRPSWGVASRSRRVLAAAVAVLALAVGACSAESTDASPRPPAATASLHAGEEGTVIAARSAGPLEVFPQPHAPHAASTLPATNDLGSPLVLLVVDLAPGPTGTWAEVLLPGRPNGRTGWVPTSAVKLNAVDHEVVIDLQRRELAVRAGDATVLTTPIAVGDTDHPTPTGRFSITDKLASPDPGGLYGPFAFGLSGRSDVLTEFAGGDGQIGIHGTNDPSSIGQAASHGCVRVPNDMIIRLNELLSLGTPVTIT